MAINPTAEIDEPNAEDYGDGERERAGFGKDELARIASGYSAAESHLLPQPVSRAGDCRWRAGISCPPNHHQRPCAGRCPDPAIRFCVAGRSRDHAGTDARLPGRHSAVL